MKSKILKIFSFLKSLNKNQLKQFISLSFEMVKEIIKGHYKSFSWLKFIIIILIIGYVILPIDFIPDFIIFFGWLDDVSLLLYGIKLWYQEIQKYAAWKKINSVL